MKKTRKEIEEAWDRAMNLRVTDDWEAPKTFAEALGIEIEDPEPEVVLDFGDWYRLRYDGSIQYRTPSNAWVRCEVDENCLAKIAEEISRLAQRKDAALKIAVRALSRIASPNVKCGNLSTASHALDEIRGLGVEA